MIPFTPWPAALAEEYYRRGYWLDLPLTDILQRQMSAQPDALALICGARRFTYRELDELSTRLGYLLIERGVRAGDTALVQLPNTAEFYLVFFALLKIGAAPVNALFSHQRLELLAYAQQLKPYLVIGAAKHRLFANEQFTDELKTSVPSVDLVLVAGETAYAENLLDLLFDAAIAVDRTADLMPSPADQVAFFQLSGGSTGTPKLIPRTHNDYYYSIRRSAEICELTTATRYLCALPAGHNFPLSSPGALGIFYAGGAVVLASDPEPVQCFALIEQHQVTMTALVPSAVSLWLQAAAERKQQLASLQLLQVGGANFAEAQARRVPGELGCKLQQVFGMAEGLVNYTRLDDPDDKIFTTQGRPMSPADEVLVVDEAGEPVAYGEPGLLLTRGPYTFRGYFQSPEHNARVIDANGFYCSGDIVQQSAEGYLRVVGREKDQINRGGEKIAAEEIENLLLKHPAIIQAALVSVPDTHLGEKSCACLVVHNSAIQLPELRKFLRNQGLAEYKLPDRFKLFERLPLTAVGKTDKPLLRRQLQEQLAVSAVVAE